MARKSKAQQTKQETEVQSAVIENEQNINDNWNDTETDKQLDDNGTKIVDKRNKKVNVLNFRRTRDYGRYYNVARTETPSSGIVYSMETLRFKPFGIRETSGRVHILIDNAGKAFSCVLSKEGALSSILPIETGTALEREVYHNLQIVLRHIVPTAQRTADSFYFGTITEEKLIPARNDLKFQRELARKSLRGETSLAEEQLIDTKVFAYEKFVHNTREEGKMTYALNVKNGTIVPE